MTPIEFEQVKTHFEMFHREFAPLFGRPQTERRSEQYLRGLLVQQTDRRNAENIAEVLEDASPRALQRFLTESPWSSQRLIERLQRYLGPRLSTPEAVYVVDETGFPKQGDQSVGVAHQYCGTLGKVANCQVGVFLAYVSERGHALIDKRLFLPKEWTDDPDRCRRAGVPDDVEPQTKVELALAMVAQAHCLGHLPAQWLTADEHYGQSPHFRDAVAAEGLWYVVEVPSITPIFARRPQVAIPDWSGRGRQPTRLRLLEGEPTSQTVHAYSATLKPTAWQTLSVVEGSQGPRTYQFVACRVCESRDGLPDRDTWLVLRRNLDGTQLKFYLSNAPADTPLATLAYVGAMRWPIETEFQTAKGETGLDEYEVRTWQGWQHHITMALLAGAFLLTLQQGWGEKDAYPHPPATHASAARVPAAPSLVAR